MILHDLLLAVEVLGLEVELGAVDQGLGRGQADDLALDDAGAVALGEGLDHLIGDIQRGILIVDHVHGDLSDAAVLEHEAHGLAAAEAARRAADDLGDLLGDLNIRGLEVAVERDQRHTGADGGDAGGGVDLALAVVGSPVGLQELLGHALELALAAGGEIAALGTGGAVLIQEGGDLQLVPDTLGNALGHLDSFLNGHVHLGNEGDNVGSAHALVLAVMLVHVDALGGDLRQLEGDLLDGLGRADEGEDAAVVVAVGLGVKQGAAGNALGGLDEGVIGGLVLFLGAAEIGDAFDQLCHGCFPPSIYFVSSFCSDRRAAPVHFCSASPLYRGPSGE